MGLYIGVPSVRSNDWPTSSWYRWFERARWDLTGCLPALARLTSGPDSNAFGFGLG